MRALIVILILATPVFILTKKPACNMAMADSDFVRRRNVWFGITLAVFLAHDYWIYTTIVAVLLLLILPREKNRSALFFFLLFAAPSIPAEVSGLGVIRYFFDINYVRLLTLVILLPEFLRIQQRPALGRFGEGKADKFVLGFICVQVGLMFMASTLTNTLRQGVFYEFMDIILPYYVMSRSQRTLQELKDTLMAFAVAAIVMGLIATVEFARHWLLYASLPDALGVSWNFGGYLEREPGDLRAQGSTGQPIPLGYVMTIALGFWLYLKKSVAGKKEWMLGAFTLLAGLAASVSRGPWVGTVAMVFVFVALGKKPVQNLVKLGSAGAAIFLVLLVSPAGGKLIDLLPFVGTVEVENIDYRQRLLEISIQLIMQNPWFGAYDYIYSPAMQELKQGQGMIDIVNTYLAIGLSNGLVGLGLFLGFFFVVVIGVYKSMKLLDDKAEEERLLGRTLLATLAGILVIIFTVSSITVIPVLYWSVAGLSVAYIRLLHQEHTETVALAVNRQPKPLVSG
ncbi:MAG TPA: O-antigen ligase family protein [Rhodocyclaceae bacterium]|nr:O-antigen ligase family protein [Rhodocyclaceae bacterium]